MPLNDAQDYAASQRLIGVFGDFAAGNRVLELRTSYFRRAIGKGSGGFWATAQPGSTCTGNSIRTCMNQAILRTLWHRTALAPFVAA